MVWTTGRTLWESQLGNPGLGTETSWQLIIKGTLVILAIAIGEYTRRRAMES